jgi:hypothetical protein
MPADELRVAAGTRAVLLVVERRAVSLVDCVAYSNGFEFTIARRPRHKLPMNMPGPLELMTIKVAYPNGAMAGSSQDAMTAHYEAACGGADPPVPDGPVVGMVHGGGSEMHYNWSF